MSSDQIPTKKADSALRSIATFDSKLLCYSPHYTFVLCYVLTNVVLFFIAAVEEYQRWPSDALVRWTIAVARGSGSTLNLNIALIVFLACRATMGALRTSPLSTILPIDQAMPELHSLVGYVSFGSAATHTLFHCIAGLSRGFWAPGFGKWTWLFITGVLLVLLFALMVATAVPPARRKNFERFINVHLYGAVLFVLLFFFHGFHRGKLYSWRWIVGPSLLYVADRLYRTYNQNSAAVHIRLGSSRRSLIFGEDIVRLSVPKSFRYKAGQYAEICIPEISKTQWHPFTIASAPYEEDLIFFIKKLGNWTTDLHKLCRSEADPKTGEPILSFEVRVRGPYGAPAQHVGQYDKVLLISGGVGATPFCSITKSINETISRQRIIKKPAEVGHPSSSFRGEWSSSKSSAISVDYRDQGPDLGQVGATADYDGIRRPKRMVRSDLQNLARRPTLARHDSECELDGCIPTQTWPEFFHTIASTAAYNTAMLWILLLRLFIDIMGLAFLKVDMEAEGTNIFKSKTLTYVDLLIATISLSLLLFANAVELIAEKRLCIEEVFLLIPLSTAPIVLHILALKGIGVTGGGTFSVHYFWIIWPLLLVLSLLRYFRVLGRRALLSDTVRRTHQTTKSVDFIWTTPTRADDNWLVEEFNRTVGMSPFVRLHRFITRENPGDDEEGGIKRHRVKAQFDENVHIFGDHFGRPQWQEIFDSFTSKMKNGTTAGIFFCGPPQMAVAVKKAATNSMLDSRYRGMSNHFKSNQALEPNSLLFSQGVSGSLPDSLTRSFNVRFVFREEKF